MALLLRFSIYGAHPQLLVLWPCYVITYFKRVFPLMKNQFTGLFHNIIMISKSLISPLYNENLAIKAIKGIH